MKIARTKNTIRNVLFGFAEKLANIILPFISRTVIIYVLGEKFLGLSSLFTSVLSFLSLAELGIGSAMVYSMYKPIAENDSKTINALLNLYKRLYRIIGVIVMVCGIAVVPMLHIIVNDDLPSSVNLYLLYIVYLLNAVLSYWVFAYNNAIVLAFQRGDINSKISLVIVPLSYVFMLGSLVITQNYYSYVIWLPVFTIITNLVRAFLVHKQFPQYKPKGEVNDELKQSISKKVKALVGTKLNTVVLNAADNIVMSAFLGLTVIAIYGNYYLIMNSLFAFLGIIYTSMTAGLGNSLAIETREKNYLDFLKFSFMNSWMVGWCAVCLVCLYQPFMKIWVGERLMFPFGIVLQFGLYFYIYQIRKIPVVYKDAAGIWWEDRFRPYVCMVVNLVLNIILVQYIGVSGIILSTVFSLMISIPWENYTVFKYIFQCSSKKYYLKMLRYLFTMIVAGGITFYLCSFCIDGILGFFIKGIICLIVPNILFYIFNHKEEECKGTILFIKNRLLKI
ncbi:lipopolysaccharide biosynthesis protein [Bariatricus sp. HCP28S3_D3]|uniref:lipopolysaccharide biosynthesis protein n=1 Tax=Bariatricus sp. HCP28S3_D3 TaxID=3438901 RepID=UPI003F8B5BDC